MAANPVVSPELAALHHRIGRDLAELRLRLRKGSVSAGTVPGDLLEAVIKVARTLRFGPVISERAGIAWVAALGAAAGLAAGRLFRARCSGGRPARGL